MKIKLKKIRQIVLVLILMAVAGYGGYRYGQRSYASVEAKADLSLFWEVWERLERKYIDQKDIKKKDMIDGAISGMVRSLGDPYTMYLPAEENKISQQNLSGSFGGVGIRLGYKKGQLAVMSPLKDTPADKAGVQAGDLILKIKDENKDLDKETTNITLDQAVKDIRGPKGSDVILTLAREGKQETFDVTITRGEITIPALEEKWIERDGKQFAYIHLLHFSENTPEEWDQWVDNVLSNQKENFGGAILDLRNNPGGYLQGAVYVGGEFLPQGKVVVKQEDYRDRVTEFKVDRRGQLQTTPLVVLVNQGSASAAEILAGALQVHERATVVGRQSFGKGTVQEPQQLRNEGGLHITIAKWLLPNGDSIDEQGVRPDIEVSQEQLEQAEEDQDIILDKAIEQLQ
jgi:carboxyl-terminal processing protease